MRGDVNKSDFSILFIEMFQHLEDVSKSVNQYFPTDQCRKLQAGAGVKEPLRERQSNDLV